MYITSKLLHVNVNNMIIVNYHSLHLSKVNRPPKRAFNISFLFDRNDTLKQGNKLN